MNAYALLAHSGPEIVARVTAAGEVEILDPDYARQHPAHLRAIEAYAEKVGEWAARRPREQAI